MISYHFLWDLVYLYNADIPWYKSHGAYIWQQSICWTFILLAGFSWHLGKKHMKRGLWAFGGGVVVSLVTAIVLPNDRVRYGVLTLIGSCILIWILLDKVLKKIPAGVRGVQLRKHSKAREKRYSFGYAVSFIFACYQILWTFPKSRYLCSRYLPLVCG